MNEPIVDKGPFGIEYVVSRIDQTVNTINAKMDTFATKAEVAYIAAKVEQFVTRSEVDERFKEINTKLSCVATKDDLNQGPFAPWFLPAISSLLSIVSVIVAVTISIGVHKQ